MENSDKFKKLNEKLQEHAAASGYEIEKADGTGESRSTRSASAQITSQNKLAARNVSTRAAFDASHSGHASSPNKPAPAKPPAQPTKPKPIAAIKPMKPLKPIL